MSKRFVSWIAVSSLPQAKKISLEDQLAINREHVARWNGALVEELSVPGKSRSIVTWEEACVRIPAYARLKQLLEQEPRPFDVLIYRDTSRLGRTASLIATIAELCYRAGILLYSTESPPHELAAPTRNLAARMVEMFQSLIAQDEVDKFTRRNEMGMKARVMRGDFPGAIPFGWTSRFEIKDGQPITVIEIDDAAACAIKTIVDLYLHRGLGMRPIAVHLQANAIAAPRGGRWRIHTVSQTLDIIWRYAGYVELNVAKGSKRPYVRAKSKWPAIISEADAIAVVKERKARAVGKRAVQSPYRFSGVAWCGQCGRRLNGSTVSGSKLDGSKKPTREKYRCRDFETVTTHPKAQIAGSYIMTAVHEAFLELKDETSHERILGQSQHRVDEISGQMEQIGQRVSAKKRALAKADELYLDEKIDLERYTEQVNRLNEEWQILQTELVDYERELEQELFNNQRADRLKEIARNGLRMLETDDIATANAWLRHHIKVWIHNATPHNRVRIEYL